MTKKVKKTSRVEEVKKSLKEQNERTPEEFSKNLRERWKDSYFLPADLDDSIIGVNTITSSILYDGLTICYHCMEDCKKNAKDHGGFDSDEYYHHCYQLVCQKFDNITKWEKEGLLGDRIPPTMVTLREYLRMTDFVC